MATNDVHIQQHNHNIALVEYLKKADFIDWSITGYFYASLHYINAYLQDKQGAKDLEIKGHKLVRSFMRKKGLIALDNEFKDLQSNSHAARYLCKASTKRLEEAKKSYDRIIKQCV